MARKPTTTSALTAENVELRVDLQNRMVDLDNQRRLVKSQLDRERLTEITGNLIKTITSPQVVENMRKFRAEAQAGASFEEAADLMSLESLKQAGAEIPDDFRLTSRVFEDFETGMRVEIRPPLGQIDDFRDDLAWGACAGGGAATVCGCAGGST